jgi:hypothetical protein
VEIISCGFSRHGEIEIFYSPYANYANRNSYKKPTAAAPLKEAKQKRHSYALQKNGSRQTASSYCRYNGANKPISSTPESHRKLDDS